MAPPIRLQLLCRNCDKASTIELDITPRKHLADEAKWTCPECDTSHRTGVIGRVISVTPGHVNIGTSEQ